MVRVFKNVYFLETNKYRYRDTEVCAATFISMWCTFTKAALFRCI